ncbi:MAG: hypothetical protein LUC24_03510 [Bacteroidales bacterium]|nr:hypothetical protein [Bacteroidales bacterium]
MSKNSIAKLFAAKLLLLTALIFSTSALARARTADAMPTDIKAIAGSPQDTILNTEVTIEDITATALERTEPKKHSEPAQAPQYPKVRLAYDVEFDFNFDNKEYESTDMYKSNTIFGARLTPSVGVEVIQNQNIRHYVMVGIDVMKDFGRGADTEPGTTAGSRYQNWDLFHEITLYYRLDYQFKKTGLNLYAGIFPKSVSKAEYPDSFVSDSLRFYDNNYEGLLLTFDRPRSYYEVGCDWMGYYGTYDRERFMIFSYGRSALKPWLSIGYSAYLYHYANSEVARGVCDNALLNPFIDFDFAPFLPLQRLAITVGWLQALQRDRINASGFDCPGGGEITVEARKWNVGILNRLYIGKNLQPYYNNTDAADYKFGPDFYRGESFYRLFEDGNTSDIGIYDKLEVYWQPHICDFLDLRVSLDEHFLLKGINGFQQKVSLIFNLNKLLKQ